MSVMDLLKLTLECAILFVCGSALFDVVHYILHVFEKSRFGFLRWLGGFHTVHHDFLDREMKIQRQYTVGNLILHVIPEYLTAVIGIALLGAFVFSWLPALIVIGIRTVMVVVYVAQKGQDFTHAPIDRIDAQRSLMFVGPHYHALHHVYPYQYYSSFVNVFDLVFGTNFEIKERRFLVLGKGPFVDAIEGRLVKLGGSVQRCENFSKLNELLQNADVLIISPSSEELPDEAKVREAIEAFKTLGLKRLVPPEVWGVDFKEASVSLSRLASEYRRDKDLTYRSISIKGEPNSLDLPSADRKASFSLFFLKRGFCRVPRVF